MFRRILVILIAASILLVLIVYSQLRPRVDFVSGVVQAHDIRLGSRVGGRVQEVFVSEGDTVQAGTQLVQLEPYDLLHLEQQATAELAAREADLHRLTSGMREKEIGQAKARFDQLQAELELLQDGPRKEEIEAAKSRLAAAESEHRLAKTEHSRLAQLAATNAAARADLDRATERLDAAMANEQVRQSELAILEAGAREHELERARARAEEARLAWELAQEGYRDEDIESAKAARDGAKAALQAIQRQLNELTIVAPNAGHIDALDLEPGDIIAAGAPVLTMVSSRPMWVRAYVPQELLQVEIGERLRVTVDNFPNQEFTGTVTFISQNSEFTPSNVQTSADRARQVYRIKVSLDDASKDLRPGMTANVWLNQEENR